MFRMQWSETGAHEEGEECGGGLPPPDFYWLGMTTFSSTADSLPPSLPPPSVLLSALLPSPLPTLHVQLSSRYPHHKSICYNVSILNLKERSFKFVFLYLLGGVIFCGCLLGASFFRHFILLPLYFLLRL